MFDDPDSEPTERAATPSRRAEEASARFRMHAELAAAFEGPRKFDAELLNDLDANTARDIQRTIGQLEKSRDADSPLIPNELADEAIALLKFDRSSNDYHIHRRPGEVMIVRWLSGKEVDTFYERLQAHFDAALNAFRDDERASLEWQQSPETLEYLTALGAVEVDMPQRYLREVIRQHRVFIMTTQTADEMNIVYLTETVMGVPTADLVGARSAPPSEPSDQDLAWFFKLFSLRGIVEGVERMCFFIYLQKSDDSFDED
ncbi:MAG: hypothetical protein JO353_08740 [Phycisphaerae bacterium]|nr:hypothetical protein [Phycisphaerae bacterium]